MTPAVTGASVDGARLLDRIEVLARRAPGVQEERPTEATEGGPAAGGGTSRAVGGTAVTRLAWSPADLAGRELVAGWMAEVGVGVAVDAAGNLTAEWPGTEPGLGPLVSGSHLDTVVDGGALDGAYGVVGAFEIVATLAHAGERLRHPVRAVAWANEEGVVAPPFTGSRTAAGRAVDTTVAVAGGRTLADVLRAAGGDPDGLAAAAWPPIAAYVELHIEQGPVLDATGGTIGVVTGIIGNLRGTVTITGAANHAGTTPMGHRRDALVAAARVVAAVERLATDGPVDVATVGSLTVHPGNVNVVPGAVTLTYDLRSLDDAACAAAVARLRTEVDGIAAATGTTAAVSPTSSTTAVPTDPTLRALVAQAATAAGLRSDPLASGAGHDAQHLAALGPMAMIFVPSIAGVSHNGAEATSAADLVAGVDTLLATLRLADAALDA